MWFLVWLCVHPRQYMHSLYGSIGVLIIAVSYHSIEDVDCLADVHCLLGTSIIPCRVEPLSKRHRLEKAIHYLHIFIFYTPTRLECLLEEIEEMFGSPCERFLKGVLWHDDSTNYLKDTRCKLDEAMLLLRALCLLSSMAHLVKPHKQALAFCKGIRIAK
jgi:hypothetical protein